MARTRKRAFVSGELQRSTGWLIAIGALCAISVLSAWKFLNAYAALYVFLGAFVYGVVYTVWLKRRTWLNIVVGGLAGSFAVLSGAAAVDPHIGVNALILAVLLFLWTPPHFWSLASAFRQDYADAGIPMLPIVAGDARCARIIFAHTLALVVLSLLPGMFGMGVTYMGFALIGGANFVYKSWQLTLHPGRSAAMANFHASLIQLSLLIFGALLDRALA